MPLRPSPAVRVRLALRGSRRTAAAATGTRCNATGAIRPCATTDATATLLVMMVLVVMVLLGLLPVVPPFAAVVLMRDYAVHAGRFHRLRTFCKPTEMKNIEIKFGKTARNSRNSVQWRMLGSGKRFAVFVSR